MIIILLAAEESEGRVRFFAGAYGWTPSVQQPDRGALADSELFPDLTLSSTSR